MADEFLPGGPDSEVNTLSGKLPEGRDHWHVFQKQPDGAFRCFHCGLDLDVFQEQEREKHGQEKAQTQEAA